MVNLLCRLFISRFAKPRVYGPHLDRETTLRLTRMHVDAMQNAKHGLVRAALGSGEGDYASWASSSLYIIERAGKR